jgi:diguanylate cyclase (GGDEF)-like protein
VRLFLSVAVTLALVGLGGYAAISRELRQHQIETYAHTHRADADTFEALDVDLHEPRAAALRDISQVLAAVGKRPGVEEAILIDTGNTVRGAADEATLGERDSDPRIDAALSQGRAYAGHEADPEADGRDFEFVRPVTVHGERFAFEVTYGHAGFDAQLDGIRQIILIGVVIALLLGGGAFYLLGGRSLMRSHRHALERATRDGLTDLPNQRAFHDDLAQAVATADRHPHPIALVLLDLDDFKLVNDRLGHPEGDALLIRVAGALRGGRFGDRAYRVGGDEFALILQHTDSVGARATVERLGDDLAKAGAAASMGVSVLRAGQTADSLRSEADAALYEAKRRGGNRVTHFEDIRDDVVITTADKRGAVHRLIEERGVSMLYQPIWNLTSGELIGVEALARPDESYDLSGPAEAFDIAERIGRVHELDVLCAERALELDPGSGSCPLLFINVTPQTLDLDALEGDWLRDAAERAGWPLHRVVVEVTERFGARTESVIKSLARLREQGFQLALDDVGTGNAGLEMLGGVGAEFVKIDRSIVAAGATEPNARAILMAMSTFARQTGAFVIAEGIEDAHTLDFLRGVHRGDLQPDSIIEGGQGYGLGRPADAPPHGPADLLPTPPAPGRFKGSRRAARGYSSSGVR